MKASDSVAPGRRRRWGRADARRRTGRRLRRPARRRDVHVSRLRRAACDRSRLPDGSSADDGFRHEPDPLHRGAVAAVLRAGGRSRASRARRQEPSR